MRRPFFALRAVALVGILALTAGIASAQVLDVVVTKAPIASDGDVKGAVTDLVLNLIDPDPTVPGIGIYAGGKIEVHLDPSFVNMNDGPNGAVILQGWPQSPPAHLPWTTSVAGNVVTLTLQENFLPGMYGPGPKQVHLMLFGFRNPSKRGYYPIEVRIQPRPNNPQIVSDWGFARIVPRTRPSINAVSLFTDPTVTTAPLTNPLYQTMSLEDAKSGAVSLPIGFYLWGRNGAPYMDVDLKMTGARHGRLVEGGKRSAGQVEIKTPAGAANFWLRTAGPSTATNAFITGEPTGLFQVWFDPDDYVTGVYRITLEMRNGNWQRFYINVVP